MFAGLLYLDLKYLPLLPHVEDLCLSDYFFNAFRLMHMPAQKDVRGKLPDGIANSGASGKKRREFLRERPALMHVRHHDLFLRALYPVIPFLEKISDLILLKLMKPDVRPSAPEEPDILVHDGVAMQ